MDHVVREVLIQVGQGVGVLGSRREEWRRGRTGRRGKGEGGGRGGERGRGGKRGRREGRE